MAKVQFDRSPPDAVDLAAKSLDVRREATDPLAGPKNVLSNAFAKALDDLEHDFRASVVSRLEQLPHVGVCADS
jgi:hypothetical protein